MTGITINPQLVVNAPGTFNISAIGLIQGMAYPNPAYRQFLSGGVLSVSETLPMWGGVGLFNNIPGASGGPRSVLGTIVGRATALTGSKPLTGFSVFDQNYAAINTPESPVPLAGTSMRVHYYLLGSGAQIPVACDPSLVSLQGDPITTDVSWDFTNQLLVPYLGTQTISSGTYNSTTGVVVLTMAASQTFDAGDSVTLASLTGTGAYAGLNGTWTATAVSGTSVTLQATAGLGAAAITGGSLTVGGSADALLPVKLLDVQTTNCMTVNYNSATGLASWNYNGACAVIQI